MMKVVKGFFVLGLIMVGLGAVIWITASAMPEDKFTIYVDGDVISVQGEFVAVYQVLTAGGITLREGDSVYPPLEAKVVPDQAVEIKRVRTVQVITEKETRYVKTHQPTLGAFMIEAGLTVGRNDQLLADNQEVIPTQINSIGVPTVLKIGTFQRVHIHDDDLQMTFLTDLATVGAVLDEAGVEVLAADIVTPSMLTMLAADTDIFIKRAIPLTLLVDGRTLVTRSQFTTPADVIRESGIILHEDDYVMPANDVSLQANSTITIVRVTSELIFSDTPIGYETEWQPSNRLELDTTGLVVAGEAGIFRQSTRVHYANGVEVRRAFEAEWVEKQPVNEVLGYGTKIVVRILETDDGPIEYWRKVEMRVTSYTAATSGKERSDPWYGITASGRKAQKGVVAVDRGIVPWRSYIYVPDYGKGFVGDVGGGILGRWIDLGYGEDDFEWWRGYTDVYYMTPVPEPERINYLLPQELP